MAGNIMLMLCLGDRYLPISSPSVAWRYSSSDLRRQKEKERGRRRCGGLAKKMEEDVEGGKKKIIAGKFANVESFCDGPSRVPRERMSIRHFAEVAARPKQHCVYLSDSPIPAAVRASERASERTGYRKYLTWLNNRGGGRAGKHRSVMIDITVA